VIIRPMHFTKMHGAGNDFVVIDATRAPLALTREQLRHLGDRRFGVGCDQILVITAAPDTTVDFGYRIFNGASGDEVEHCGNGARCFARYVVERGLASGPEVRVRTINRTLVLHVRPDGRVTVNMGTPDFAPASLPFDPSGLASRTEGQETFWPLPLADGQVADVATLSMGNPHAVLRVADVATAPVALWGPQIEGHARFAHRVNAGFMQVVAPDAVRLRVYERDAGETLACGSGAVAAVVAGIRAGWLAPEVEVATRGGALRVAWYSPQDEGPVTLTGPATFVFDGDIAL